MMVKFILIKSTDEWATTKQTCRGELVVYLFFFPSQYILRSTSIYYMASSASGQDEPNPAL